MKKLLLMGMVLVGALATDGFAKSRAPHDVARELVKAADVVAATYRRSGMTGLIVETQTCYEKAKESPFYCIYLDLASRFIDQTFVAAMHYPPTEFFADEPSEVRIGATLRRARIGGKEADEYLKMLVPAIDQLVAEKLLRKQ